MNLNKLLEFCREKQLSLHVYFHEGDGLFDIETTSAAEAECYALKNVSSEKIFIEFWEQHTAKGGKL